MQLKWLEDFVALAETRSYTRAAELRHVTHPAFGRRIRALESWVGTPLIERNVHPPKLTAAGEQLLETSRDVLAGLLDLRTALRESGAGRDVLRIATGRTLGHTLFADWLARTRTNLGAALGDTRIQVMTRSLHDAARLLENKEADFLFCYYHAAFALELHAGKYTHVWAGEDALVPVAATDSKGRPRFTLTSSSQSTRDVPYLAYGKTLAMGRLVDDHLRSNPGRYRLRTVIECDFAEALYEWVRKGMGVGWLPWSLVVNDVKQGRLARLAPLAQDIRMEVRLYRRAQRMFDLGERVWALATQPVGTARSRRA